MGASDDGGVMHFILQLHTDMFLGLPGMLFLGVMGLLFVIAIYVFVEAIKRFSNPEPVESWGMLIVAAIGLHALNGLRIIAIDFTSIGPRIQRALFWVAIGLWLVLLAGFIPRQLMHIFGGE